MYSIFVRNFGLSIRNSGNFFSAKTYKKTNMQLAVSFPENCPEKCPLVRTPLEKFPSTIDSKHVGCLLAFAATIGDRERLEIALAERPDAKAIIFACSQAGSCNQQLSVFTMLGHITEHVPDSKIVYHAALTFSGISACANNRLEYFKFFIRIVADLPVVYLCTSIANVVEVAIETCPGEWTERVTRLLEECNAKFSQELYTETVRSLFAQNSMGGINDKFSRELAEFLLTKGTFDMNYMLSVACIQKRSDAYPFLRDNGAKTCISCNLAADEHF